LVAPRAVSIVSEAWRQPRGVYELLTSSRTPTISQSVLASLTAVNVLYA